MLLRHPRPRLPRSGICYGRLDVPLEPGWQADVDALDVPALPGAVIWSSPSPRCLAPATRLGRRLGMPVRQDNRLLELDFGAWEGLQWDRVERASLDLWASDLAGFAPPGGETGAALIERVTQVALDLGREARCAIVVSHGGPLRVLSPLLRGAPVDLAVPSAGFLESEIVTLPGMPLHAPQEPEDRQAKDEAEQSRQHPA